MNARSRIDHSAMELQVILSDLRPDIELVGQDLLRLGSGRPGVRVLCTAGALWLTQEGDLRDHFLPAGESFILNRRGMVLVQGLPRGSARILVQ